MEETVANMKQTIEFCLETLSGDERDLLLSRAVLTTAVEADHREPVARVLSSLGTQAEAPHWDPRTWHSVGQATWLAIFRTGIHQP